MDASVRDMSVDDIWEVFIAMVQHAAKEVIPRRRVGGEPRPPKSEVPLNRGIRLLGHLLRQIATMTGSPSSTCIRSSLEKTYSTLQTVFALPELQDILQVEGLTSLPDLPPVITVQATSWQVFRQRMHHLWVTLRLARTTQHDLTRAELIRTCVQRHCDLMHSNQGQMIRNILE